MVKEPPNRFPRSGFTLVTLMLTLAIMATLMTLSLPGYRAMLAQHRGEQQLQTLRRALTSGRAAAIRRNRSVTVCPSRDGKSCSGTWSDGLLVFTDAAGDRRVNDDDRRLRSLQWDRGGGQLRWRAFGNRQYLHINALGQILHQNGNFTWCPPSGSASGAGQLIINRSGRVRAAIDRNGDGIVENSRGQPIDCD